MARSQTSKEKKECMVVFSPDERKVKLVDAALKEKGSSFKEWRAVGLAKINKEVQKMNEDFQKIYDEYTLPFLSDLLADKKDTGSTMPASEE